MSIVSENIRTTNSMSWSDPETTWLIYVDQHVYSCSSSSHMLTILCSSMTEGAMIKISSAYNILVVATKYQILTLKCAKFDMARWGWELTVLPWPLADADKDWLPLRLLEPQSSQCREAAKYVQICLSLIHIWRCRRIERCRSRWSPYH